MITIFDLFVSPTICQNIASYGVDAPTIASYRVFYNETILICPAFDHLRLYAEIKGITHYRSSYEELATYTIQEVEHIIPGMCISCNNGKYEATSDTLFRIPSVEDDKMVNAAGKLLLAALQSRVVTPEYIKAKLSSFIKK